MNPTGCVTTTSVVPCVPKEFTKGDLWTSKASNLLYAITSTPADDKDRMVSVQRVGEGKYPTLHCDPGVFGLQFRLVRRCDG